MTRWVIVLEAPAFAAVFTAAVFLTCRGGKKNSAAWIHNYPPEIQEESFKTHEPADTTAGSKNVILAKSLGVVLFRGILLVCALLPAALAGLAGALIR